MQIKLNLETCTTEEVKEYFLEKLEEINKKFLPYREILDTLQTDLCLVSYRKDFIISLNKYYEKLDFKNKAKIYDLVWFELKTHYLVILNSFLRIHDKIDASSSTSTSIKQIKNQYNKSILLGGKIFELIKYIENNKTKLQVLSLQSEQEMFLNIPANGQVYQLPTQILKDVCIGIIGRFSNGFEKVALKLYDKLLDEFRDEKYGLEIKQYRNKILSHYEDNYHEIYENTSLQIYPIIDELSKIISMLLKKLFGITGEYEGIVNLKYKQSYIDMLNIYLNKYV